MHTDPTQSSVEAVPAAVVMRLRDALYGQLADVAQEIASLVAHRGREQHGEWFAEPVARFDHTRLTLDEVGWSERDPEQDANIHLDRHRDAITSALRQQLEHERYQMAERGRAAKQQRQRAYARALVIETWAVSVGLEAGS
jgi:hypothetical protein